MLMEDTRYPERQPILFKSRQDKIKTKRERKELGMETCPGEGVMKEKKFPNSRKCSHRRVCGEFWNLRGQHNREGENKQTNKHRIGT